MNPLLTFQQENFLSPKQSFLSFINDIIDTRFSQDALGFINLAIVGTSHTNQYYKDQAQDMCNWINDNITNCRAYYQRPELLRIENRMIVDASSCQYHILYRDTTFAHSESIMKPMFDTLYQAANTDTIVISDPIDLVIEQKLSLALLSTALENESNLLLEQDEKLLVSQYIPWTRVVSDIYTYFKGVEYKMIDLLQKQKNEFVLKRCHSHEGNHVYIGSEVNQNNWENLVHQAFTQYQGFWVVQENLISDKYDFKYYHSVDGFTSKSQHYTFSPFIYGHHCGGALIRIQQNDNKRVLALPTNSDMGACGIVII